MKKYTIATITIASLATAVKGTRIGGSCGRHTYTKFASPFVDMAGKLLKELIVLSLRSKTHNLFAPVFGDSFSEVGNINNASNGTQPGVWSYDGRYSDGRVWEEYLLQFFDLPNELTPSSQGGTNHAYGGATVDNTYIDAFSTYLQDNVPSVK